ncbi:HAD hydrolase family protein [Lysinibacillus sp. NPDC097231]|uniref:HAD hydrolase family protein n=1 Tax=Lysinibacillus sp. NPDC097231 TaxID=3364142 RepID=UPI00382C8543
MAFGNDSNDITMFQHRKYSVMIGESLQFASFSSEQLPLSENIESLLEKRLSELGDLYSIIKLVDL